ncbi:hypothetical protein [Salinicola tamaricis]|uniref:hypothetical protein n=1 Tax=Salinicola tamaricis TaxID=1771309 RepID=UPI00101AE1AA|nr:hypothetical protein [Salinicola tamaricis]
MTPNERIYAEQVAALRRWRMRSYILLGALMLSTVIGVVWVLWDDSYLLKGSVFGPLMIIWGVFGVFAAWRFLKLGFAKKVTLGDEVHLLKGPFSVVLRNGGPSSSSWQEYFVGNVSLRTPFLVGLVSPKNGDKEIEVAAVYLHTNPKDKWFDKYTAPEAIALYIEGQIDIDKRGR